MKTLRDYIAETDAWVSNPAPGDEFDIELAPDSLVESWVVDVVEDGVILAADEPMMALLENQGLLSERIARYGAVGSSRGMGFTVAEGVMSEIDMDLRQIAQDQDPGKLIDALQGDMGAKTAEYLKNMMQDIEQDMERQGRGFTNDVYRNLDILMDRIVAMYADEKDLDESQEPVAEDYIGRMLELAGLGSTAPIQPNPNAARTDPLAAKAADLAPVGTEKDPGTATTIDEGVMSEIVIELGEIADAEDYDRLYDLLTARTPAGQMVQKIANDITIDHRLRDDDHERLLQLVMDYIVDEFGGQLELDEAEYQGRKVPLGKPMRGDVKKFKVYVKDPKTGNVKKVNFGHGGKSAKRAGEKTLSIKKSNPARRRSFRARHRCDNPGPRTKARYWACRAW